MGRPQPQPWYEPVFTQDRRKALGSHRILVDRDCFRSGEQNASRPPSSSQNVTESPSGRHIRRNLLTAPPIAKLSIMPVGDESHPDYTPGLRECIMGAPRQIGCEAAHFFPVGMDVCQLNGTDRSDANEENGDEPEIEVGMNHYGGHGEQESSRERETRTKGGGTLALHVRSGDIFAHPVPHHGYGQVRTL